MKIVADLNNLGPFLMSMLHVRSNLQVEIFFARWPTTVRLVDPVLHESPDVA